MTNFNMLLPIYYLNYSLLIRIYSTIKDILWINECSDDLTKSSVRILNNC